MPSLNFWKVMQIQKDESFRKKKEEIEFPINLEKDFGIKCENLFINVEIVVFRKISLNLGLFNALISFLFQIRKDDKWFSFYFEVIIK